MSATTDALAPARAIPQSACFACGPDNPRGLHLSFLTTSDGSAVAHWTPDHHLQGFRGIVHGGVVSTALDEAMSKAVSASGTEALTAELRVRLRSALAPGSPYLLRGWLVRRHRRLLLAEASLCSPAGLEVAHAWATFLELKYHPR